MNEELIEKAQQAYDSGHYDQAVTLMEEAYLKNKKELWFHKYKGEKLLWQNLKSIQKILKRQKRN